MRRSTPPLLAALFAIAVVVTVALAIFAWRLATSQSTLAAQQRAAQADAEAGALASGLRQQLAETGERMSAWLGRPAADPPLLNTFVLLTWHDGEFRVTPAGGVSFLPEAPPAPPAPSLFDRAESLEFAAKRPLDAARLYRQLTAHADPAIRAGAYLRLGRALRTAHRGEDALDAFRALEKLGAVRLDVTGLPAELVGLAEQIDLVEQFRDATGAARVRKQIADGLGNGHWAIDQPNAESFRHLSGDAPKTDAWRLAEVAAATWNNSDARLVPRGRSFVDAGGRGVVAIWRSAGSTAAMAVAWTDVIITALAEPALAWQLTRNDTVIAGHSGAPPSWAAPARLIDDNEGVELRGWRPQPAATDSRNVLIVWLAAATIAFLWAATYFVARAIRREAAVAQLQSDFVSAVSHEFRSPLTTIRQMAEMLRSDRVAREDRRREYYEVLAGEATRLQRLVETLLNLGRIESGSERYDLRVIAAADVVDRAIADVAPLAAAERHAVERVPPGSPVFIRGDEDAVRLAIRNLLENAIRYSPGQPTVWVRWRRDEGQAAIDVIDHGLGLADDERESVFAKFVRGRAAAASNAKGTGVGLAMVRHVAEAHGGSASVESHSGETTFTLRLPLAPEDSALEMPA